MKIGFIGGRDIKSLGGIENYMLNLATQLVRLGHEPVVFCESDHNGEEYINGFRVIYMSGPKHHFICKPYIGLKATIKIISSIRDVDLIHYNAWPPSLWSPLARLFGYKSLMLGHGFEWRHTKYSSFQKKILRFMERLTAYTNQNLVMCSKEQSDYFTKYYHKTPTTLPNGVFLPFFNNSSTTVLNRLGIKSKKYFLFLGRLGSVKNVDVLINGFKKTNIKEFQLIIAGSNDAEHEYVDKLHNLTKDCENIIFTGGVYGNEKDELLRNAFAFCLVSSSEGMSIALLEAMSYKLPIIASDIPANREVLEVEDALWVRPENADDIAKAITKAVTDPIAFRAPIESSYQRIVQHYTWEKVAEEYISLVERILT